MSKEDLKYEESVFSLRGDYFLGKVCPFDGWSSPESLELHSAVEKLQAERAEVSIEDLRRAGLSPAALERVIVIDFGSGAASFDALSPGLYLKDGRERKVGNLGPELS